MSRQSVVLAVIHCSIVHKYPFRWLTTSYTCNHSICGYMQLRLKCASYSQRTRWTLEQLITAICIAASNSSSTDGHSRAAIGQSDGRCRLTCTGHPHCRTHLASKECSSSTTTVRTVNNRPRPFLLLPRDLPV